MFNPSSQITLDDLWDSLGTVYRNLDDSSKDVVETFWNSMFEATGALYYDLYQNHLAKYFDYSQGYIEQAYQTMDIVFEGDNKNVDEIYYTPPSGLTISNTPSADDSLYSYQVTSVTTDGETLAGSPAVLISGGSSLATNANLLTWAAVSGISQYKVYGRSINDRSLLSTVSTNSFTDDGTLTPSGDLPTANTAVSGYTYHLSDDLYYMTIPTLSGFTTNQILTEGDDYDVEELKRIKFKKSISATDTTKILYNSTNATHQKGEKFLNRSSICLLPTLSSVYLPGYGIDNPNDIVTSGNYTPYISGYQNMTYTDQRKAQTIHLAKLCYAMSVVLRREPSITNVAHGFGVAVGFPFSYESGAVTVTGIDSSYKYITITTSGLDPITYQVPVTTHLIHDVGDSVDQFALLISGSHADDYVSNFTYVSGVSLQEGEVNTFDVFTEEFTSDSFGLKVLSSFIDDVTGVSTSDTYTIGSN